ncbi:MAG: 6-bladed beta-propeller [Thermodesulfobacteriota bacterium]
MRKIRPLPTTSMPVGRQGFADRLAFFAMTLLLVFAAALFAGCSSGDVKQDIHSPQTPLIWPSPPEPARISYSMSIGKPTDIGAHKGFFRKLADLVLGPSSDDMIKPYGITVDSRGRVIVADTAFKRVHIYDIRDKKYDYIEEADGELFVAPIAAAVDANDNIYVTDSERARVFAFDRRGSFLFAIDGFKRPTGVAVNANTGRLFVSDTGRNVVEVYDLKGNKVKTIGGKGSGKAEFNLPVDLFVDINGDLYVVDTMNYRIQIFNRDGEFLTMFGRHGDGTGDFGRPKGVSVDREGNIYVADALFDTVQIFDRKGNFLLNFGALGRQAGFFWLPTGMYIDGTDKIYVADSYNKRIQIFDYLGNG